MPTFKGNMSAAVAIMNRAQWQGPTKVTFTPRSLNLTHPGGYMVKEVFENSNMGTFLPDTEIKIEVNPTGTFYHS